MRLAVLLAMTASLAASPASAGFLWWNSAQEKRCIELFKMSLTSPPVSSSPIANHVRCSDTDRYDHNRCKDGDLAHFDRLDLFDVEDVRTDKEASGDPAKVVVSGVALVEGEFAMGSGKSQGLRSLDKIMESVSIVSGWAMEAGLKSGMSRTKLPFRCEFLGPDSTNPARTVFRDYSGWEYSTLLKKAGGSGR